MRFVGSVLCCLLASGALAQEVVDCSAFSSAALRLSPQDVNSRAYANGTVTMAVVHDGRSNASDALYLVIYAPRSKDADTKQCRLIAADGGLGYANVYLRNAEPSFSVAAGLTVDVPARIFSMEDGSNNGLMLSVNVNQTTQEVTVTQKITVE